MTNKSKQPQPTNPTYPQVRPDEEDGQVVQR